MIAAHLRVCMWFGNITHSQHLQLPRQGNLVVYAETVSGLEEADLLGSGRQWPLE